MNLNGSINGSIGVDSRRVLLLLDIQEAMISPETGVPSARTVYTNLQTILSLARRNSETNPAAPPPLIVHVRNTGEQGDPDEPHAPGWQLIFEPAPGEVVIDKRKNNAFAGTNLEAIIPPDAEIVVVGFQTDFGVRATCSAALGRGNEVVLVRGGHATKDRVEVLDGGGVTPAHEIQGEIEEELEEAGVLLVDMEEVPRLFGDH